MHRTHVLYYVYLYVTFVSKCGANEYCSAIYCNNSKQHTLCKYQLDEPSHNCGAYERTIKNDNDRDAILDKLNSRRNKVAAGEIRSLPSAASMMKLEWNNELETSAQRWADQCVQLTTPDFKDSCRDLRDMLVGQNIATVHGDAPGLTPMSLVDVWYMELLNTNATLLARYKPSREIGHTHYDYFTQLIWEESHQVGCGGVKFKERLQNEVGVNYRTIYRLVCNFAPAGNRRNRTVYAIGEPCSRCPNDGVCDKEYKALCVNTKRKFPKVYTQDLVTFKPSTVSTSVIENTTHDDAVSSDENTDNFDEMLNPNTESTSDYFAHVYPATKQTNTLSSKSCKNVMAVDELFELLKAKINDDKQMKNMVLTPNNESSYKDDVVAAFLNRIYSKKNDETTMRSTTASDYLNSTLLVDLIEAVIFRSSDKPPQTQAILMDTQAMPMVQSVVMQAELAEVKENAGFTGHYFFPEDNEEATERPTESYYDDTLSGTDSMMEIEDLRMTTKDFLDDILESDPLTEKDIEPLSSSKVFSSDLEIYNLRAKIKRERNNDDFSYDSNECTRKPPEPDYVICYKDFLRKIASDLSLMKLNKIYHCSQSNSGHINSLYLVYFLMYAMILIIE